MLDFLEFEVFVGYKIILGVRFVTISSLY